MDQPPLKTSHPLLLRRSWLSVATGGLALALIAAIWVVWRFG
jgi:hypothetical protein